MENKVAVIGNDYINTLGVVRALGENGIEPYIFLISKRRGNAAAKSRYTEECVVCRDEQDAVDRVIERFGGESGKVALIPTSDSAALCLDENYERLKDAFFTPNVMRTAGEIRRFMNKSEQQKLLGDNPLKGIESVIFDLNGADPGIAFPLILKPVASVDGDKDDIRICRDETEFGAAKRELKDSGYTSVLAQEFLSYDLECDVPGFSFGGESSIPCVVEKIRIYPPERGSTTYGTVVPAAKYAKAVEGIKKIMKELRYTGIFDIEMFVAGEDVYLNEINFRNSAIAYACGDAYVPYYWYLSCVEGALHEPPAAGEPYTFIDDQADLHNVKDRIITPRKYRADRRGAGVMLAKNRDDPRPSRKMFINKLKDKIKN